MNRPLDDFNSITIDYDSMKIKIKDEDKTILLVVPLSPSYRQFKDITLYSNHETISFNDVKANLLSKEQFDRNTG